MSRKQAQLLLVKMSGSSFHGGVPPTEAVTNKVFLSCTTSIAPRPQKIEEEGNALLQLAKQKGKRELKTSEINVKRPRVATARA